MEKLVVKIPQDKRLWPPWISNVTFAGGAEGSIIQSLHGQVKPNAPVPYLPLISQLPLSISLCPLTLLPWKKLLGFVLVYYLKFGQFPLSITRHLYILFNNLMQYSCFIGFFFFFKPILIPSGARHPKC